MSHMAALTLHVTNINDLRNAVASLGLSLEERSNWRWFNSWVDDYHGENAAYKHGIQPSEYGKCAEYVITIPNDAQCYEIGVVPRRDGKPGWMLCYDFYAGGKGMSNYIGGVEGKKLEHAYTLAKAQRMFGSQNFKISHVSNYDAKTKTTTAVLTRPKVKSHK